MITSQEPDADSPREVTSGGGTQSTAPREEREENVAGNESLEDLLDDALNDFDQLSTSAAAAPVPDSLADQIPSVSQGVPEVDPTGKQPPRKQQPKGLAFNPLPVRAKPGTGSSNSKRAEPPTAGRPLGGDFGAIPPDVSDLDEELSKGLAQLMRELADVDGLQSGSSGKSGQSSELSEMSETLRALQEQSAALRSASGNAEAPQPSGAADIFSDPMFAGLQEHLGGGGDNGENAVGSLADSLMRQLLSKDVLYQPMKDIGERYPEWLEAHRESLSAEESERYNQQFKHIQAILAIYEHSPDNYSELFQALQQMQACGQPPQDIVNDLAPGMVFDEEGLPKLAGEAGGPPGCSIQ